ncbi:hypothetical protein PSV08DRAFT_373788 [Bipolaris maydis]|uniref:uncharacterized protein n=1 Tax=Cochliobolus heterostrophus TaxID=5016 RepID=UPI0024D13FDD|nr:hypothetical protein PSV08DRAFT_373485 [Bipolaris maydis]KAJ6267722.1 hypothetical protein PSV08DRAFT_373788 [Bipolaris maydis]
MNRWWTGNARESTHHRRSWGNVLRAARKIISTRDHGSQCLAQEHNGGSSQPSEVDGLIQISLKEAIAWVQPNVTMDALVQSTMRVGLIPTVVASSKNTTVLEAFATETCGSSSFRYGTFSCAVLSVKVVVRDVQELTIKLNGDTIDQHFGNYSVSHRLDSITLFEIALIPAGNYVEMTYWPVRDIWGATLRMMPKTRQSLIVDRPAVDEFTDLLDVLIFESTFGVVVTGRFMPTTDNLCSPFGQNTPFVQHAESIRSSKLQHSGESYVETVPLMDYIFRRRFGGWAALDGDFWHIQAFEPTREEESH